MVVIHVCGRGAVDVPRVVRDRPIPQPHVLPEDGPIGSELRDQMALFIVAVGVGAHIDGPGDRGGYLITVWRPELLLEDRADDGVLAGLPCPGVRTIG